MNKLKSIFIVLLTAALLLPSVPYAAAETEISLDEAVTELEQAADEIIAKNLERLDRK